MSKEYTPEMLRKLQLCEVEMLKDFAELCERNGITYFGTAGTGIGALRHGGFIPWDDDIDVGVLYKDYQKLIDLIEEEFPDKYTVVNAEKYKDYHLMNTHIVLNGSEFIEAGSKKLKFPQGIFLDIFPFFKSPADEEARKKRSKKAWYYGKLMILRHVPFPWLAYGGTKAKLTHCVTACLSVLVKLFWSHNRLYKKIMKLATAYESEDTGFNEWFFDTAPGGSIYTDDEIFPLRKLRFENIEVCFPNKLEEHLTTLYGNYMQLPPPEKRKNHCPVLLKFPE